MSDESFKPPDGLKTAERQLWDSVDATFVLNAGEIEILRQAAATADEIAMLGAELRASSLVVAGYSGQPRPNPLLSVYATFAQRRSRGVAGGPLDQSRDRRHPRSRAPSCARSA
jgi:hypothetical protein